MTQMQIDPDTAGRRPSPVKVKKIGHIVLRVRDIERSVRFYTEILNFRLTEIGLRGAFLNTVGDHHTIGLFQVEDGPVGDDVVPNGVRLDHFAMEVESMDDLFAIRAFLREHDVPIFFEGRRLMGGHTSIEFLDPDGYHLEFYCDMDTVRDGVAPRPVDPRGQFLTLEDARDNPKSPGW
jgi:catechol 2,3-dioxygenase-like lactoylglutathione lyase family enzyme